MNINQEALKLHEKLKGKLEINSKIQIKTKKDLSLIYTPGVAEPCKKIFENKEDAFNYTIKNNTLAVISNGTAVLGLGNIGANAAIPVMEGKCQLFKELAGINAFPICIDSEDIKENINIIKKISPVFGAVNLEDYKAPECFEIETGLQDLGIPVMHDDQHGTAIVILAGLINSLKLTDKNKENIKIVISGAGSAAIATTKLLIEYGFNSENIILLDSKGAICKNRKDLNKYKQELAEVTNRNQISGSLEDAIKNSDVFIGLSKPDLLTKEMIQLMNNKPVIFALANPNPEINPDKAKEAGAFIIATGRSDFPNQVNNALVFPGIFKGALQARAKQITLKMKLSAAIALANSMQPKQNQILPDVLDKSIPDIIAKAVIQAVE